MNVSAPFIHRPVATSLLTLGVALAGIVSFFQLPVAPLPQVDFPTISVTASLPGAAPETMAATVATPLERALGGIAGVNEITSSSSLGNTRVTLQFDLNRDINSFGGDVLTEPLPETIRRHGDQLDPGGSALSADDPVMKSDVAVATTIKRLEACLTGKSGKELPLVLEQVITLSLWRAGYRMGLAEGKESPHNADALDPAGVSLLTTAGRYGRVRAVLNPERILVLPQRLAKLRFRRQIYKAISRGLKLADRLVVDAEGEVDEVVRPAVAVLEPMTASMPTLKEELGDTFALVKDPAKKAQATRAAFERAGQEAFILRNRRANQFVGTRGNGPHLFVDQHVTDKIVGRHAALQFLGQLLSQRHGIRFWVTLGAAPLRCRLVWIARRRQQPQLRPGAGGLALPRLTAQQG